MSFFDKTGISPSFLDKDPTEWENDAVYLKVSHIVRHLKVVNDAAERGVALVTRYMNTSANKLSEDEPQRQLCF